MVDLVRDEAGQLFIDDGARLKPVTEDEAQFFLENQGAGSGLVQSAGAGVVGLLAGATSLMADEGSEAAQGAQQVLDISRRQQELLGAASPVAAGVGGMVPAIAAGAATAGYGLPAVMGTEAALGAASSPEAPWTGAAIGAGTVGALGAAGRVLSRAADSAMPAVGMVPSARGSATDRVLGAVDDTTAGPRVHEGLLTADELEAMTGQPLTAGQRMQLEARANNPAEIEAAMRKRYTEDLLGKQGGYFGQKVMESTNALRAALDDQVRRVTGIPKGVAFNEGVIGDQLKLVGDDIGNLMDQVGWVKIDDDAIGAMQDRLKMMSADAREPLQSQLDELRQRMDSQGHVTGEQYQTVYRMLGIAAQQSDSAPGISQVVAEQMRKTMEDALEESAGKTVRDALQAARYKYRILKRLGKPGAVGRDGSINVTSFRRSLQKGMSDKRKGKDPIARLAETIATVTDPTVHTGNTLYRAGNWGRQAGNSMTTPQGAASALTGGGVMAAGTGLAGWLLDQ